MRASVCRRYGPPSVVEIVDVPLPKVGKKDVLIRTRATTVSAGDWRLRSGKVPRGFGLFLRLAVGFAGPRDSILGTELAGDVVEVGPAVTRFKPGDRVFASRFGGCHAEFAAMPEDAVAPMPKNLGFPESAALTFGGLTAVTFLRDKGAIRPGERVLVNGASGAVGTAAVQIARHFGAGNVTGVCSAANAALVRSLGAEEVIDYAAEDFAARRGRYDIILDAVGNCSFARCKGALAPGGRLLLAVGTLSQILGAILRPSRAERKVASGMAQVRVPDMLLLAALAESRAYKPVIDRTYPLERIVEAYEYVDTGRKRGNVAITVD
jgi:NADPH:quinone reductase-like Zn-dependent oxidoreductase